MAANPERAQEFEKEIAALRIKGGSSAGERPLANLGILLMVAGVGITIVANTNLVDEGYIITVSLLGVAVTVAGAAVFLRYSIGRYLRFWLVRQIHEQRIQTDRLLAVLDPSSAEDGEPDGAEWPRVWPGAPGEGAAESTEAASSETEPESGAADAPSAPEPETPAAPSS